MPAYGNLDLAIAGARFGMNPITVETGIPQEAIAFGAPVFAYPGVEQAVWAAHADRVTTLLDADLVASNVLTTTINGNAVATTYGTSHAATMTAHIAAINALAALIALNVTATANGARGIIIKTTGVVGVAGIDLTVTQAVTLGSSQAGSTQTVDTWAKFVGIAMFSQQSTRDLGAGSMVYPALYPLNICSRGTVYANTGSVTVYSDTAAYVVLAAGATQGQFTNVSTNNYDIKSFFRNNSASGLTIIDVNGVN